MALAFVPPEPVEEFLLHIIRNTMAGILNAHHHGMLLFRVISTRTVIWASGPPNFKAFSMRFENISESRSSAQTSVAVSSNETLALGTRSSSVLMTRLKWTG